MRALAVVPARGGSTRVLRKNLARVGGLTLVRRVLETALASGCFAEVALSSDDPGILAEAAGLDVVALRRPAALAIDKATSLDVVLHALSELEPRVGRFDSVAILQATSPFTAPEDVRAAAALIEAGAESVVTVARVLGAIHPAKLKVLGSNGRLEPYFADDALARSQDLPSVWARNGSLYWSQRDVLDRGSFISERDLRGVEMPPERSLDIDTPRDLAFARFLVGEAGYRDSLPEGDAA